MTHRYATGILILSALLACAAPPAARAAESYDNCAGTISSLPATISTQGVWCMKSDLSTNITSGIALTINTNNVTIDCNDFKLGGLAAGNGSLAIGIDIENRQNTTIRHCNLRGFYFGIYLFNGAGHMIEDNRLDNNYVSGIHADSVDSTVIRRNRVFDTGGSTATPVNAIGIYSSGTVGIEDNLVQNVFTPASTTVDAYGIRMAGGTGSVVSGNTVRGLTADVNSSRYGIYTSNGNKAVIVDNRIIDDDGTLGIRCNSNNGSARGNTVWGFAAGIDNGCFDDGGNAVH